jgi:hypothetical protein
MLVTDKPQFLKVLNGIAVIKRTPLVPEAIELWWGCLADWSIEDFKAATIAVLKRTAYMPTPKDFEDLRKAGRETPGEAWITARAHVKWGLHAFTLRDDCPPLVARAVRAIGGPNVIGMCDEDKLPFLERRFTEHFESMQDSEEVRAAVPQIAAPERLRLKLDAAKKLVTR